MRLVISNALAQKYPDLRVGIVVAHGIDNKGNDASLEELKRLTAANLRSVHSSESIMDHRNLVAWRETYRGFGANPKKTPPTVETLAKRIIKGKDLPTISKAVDLYLVAELESLLPVGGYDLHQIDGNIVLRESPGNERFVPLGGQADSPELTKPGEIVYSDDSKVLTRFWNYRDCELSKITESSTDIALFCEAALELIPSEDLNRVTQRIQEYVLRFCGGESAIAIVKAADQLECVL